MYKRYQNKDLIKACWNCKKPFGCIQAGNELYCIDCKINGKHLCKDKDLVKVFPFVCFDCFRRDY